jgi:hypothetical protein
MADHRRSTTTDHAGFSVTDPVRSAADVDGGPAEGDDSPGCADALDRFYLFERTAHMAACSFAPADGLGLATYAPFLDPVVLDVAFSLPPETRRRGDLHRHLQLAACRRLLRPPTDKGRPQFPGGPLGRHIGRVRGRLWRRRHRPSAMHAYGRWLAVDNLEFVRRVLSPGACETLGLDPPAVTDLIDLCRTGAKGAVTALGNLIGVVGFATRGTDGAGDV